MVDTQSEPKGMKIFLTIWAGQLLSLIGSGLTGFALGVWIYATTGKATPFALVVFLSSIPRVLLAPLGGVVADRYNRRWVMFLADTGAALVTLFAAWMIFSDSLVIWMIYLVAFLESVFGAFQSPAYQASVVMLVPKKDLGRASGFMQGSQAIEMLLSPILGGFLYKAIGLKGIIAIDFATYFFALAALLMVRIPQPERQEEEKQEKASWQKEAIFGWHYIRARAGLFGILIFFALVNFLANLAAVLTSPLILSFADPAALGMVSGLGGFGMLAGSILMGAWGGPKRRMHGVYGFIALFGVGFIIVGLQPSVWLIALGFLMLMFVVPLGSGTSQAIWMSKVAPDVQGRVFAIRSMISMSIMPLAFLIAGPLADVIFNPMLEAGGSLAGTVGQVVGVGPGRGIGLIFVISGLFLLLATAAAYAHPRIRLLEDELPDVLLDTPPQEEMATETASAPA